MSTYKLESFDYRSTDIPHTMSASSESYVTNIIITVTSIIISFSMFMERGQAHCIVRYSHRSLVKIADFQKQTSKQMVPMKCQRTNLSRLLCYLQYIHCQSRHQHSVATYVVLIPFNYSAGVCISQKLQYAFCYSVIKQTHT